MEVNKRKTKIKHKLHVPEVYTSFIENDKLAYSAKKGICVSCVGNYLFMNNTAAIYNLETILKDWNSFSQYCLAYIDRYIKRIIVNYNHPKAKDFIIHIPKDYEIFYASIIDKNNIYNIEYLVYDTIQCLTYYYYNNFVNDFYRVLFNYSNVLHNIEYDNYYYKLIIKYIQKYEVWMYKWYNKSINPYYKLEIVLTNKKHEFKYISLPSCKDFLENNIFNKYQLDILERCHFWTKWGKENDISYMFVTQNWHHWQRDKDRLNFITSNKISNRTINLSQTKGLKECAEKLKDFVV